MSSTTAKGKSQMAQKVFKGYESADSLGDFGR